MELHERLADGSAGRRQTGATTRSRSSRTGSTSR